MKLLTIKNKGKQMFLDYILSAFIWLTIGWLIVTKASISVTFTFATWSTMGESKFVNRIKWLMIVLWPLGWIILNIATRYVAKKHNIELHN